MCSATYYNTCYLLCQVSMVGKYEIYYNITLILESLCSKFLFEILLVCCKILCEISFLCSRILLWNIIIVLQDPVWNIIHVFHDTLYNIIFVFHDTVYIIILVIYETVYNIILVFQDPVWNIILVLQDPVWNVILEWSQRERGGRLVTWREDSEPATLNMILVSYTFFISAQVYCKHFPKT